VQDNTESKAASATEKLRAEELLAVIEKRIRSPRTNTAHLLRLQAKRNTLLKQMGHQDNPRPSEEPADHHQRFLSTLSGEKRAFWTEIFRLEDEALSAARAQRATPNKADV